ncbi:MAG: ArsR/SmtB family transcription factor [Spirochaetota bacterium]
MNFPEAQLKSTIIQSMAHPVRLLVVEFLADGEKKFSDIHALFDYDKSTISKHLSVLKSTGIISARKDGNETVYALEMCCFTAFLNCIDSIIQQNVDRQTCCIKVNRGTMDIKY